MRYYHLKHVLVSAFVLGLILFNVYSIKAQETETLSVDSVDNSIELSQVSRKSAELTLKAKDLVRYAIDENELNRLKKENEDVIKQIDSLLKRESYVKLTSLSGRNLKSKLIYWQKNLQTVNEQQLELSSVFEDLDESSEYLEEELSLWNKTDELVKGDELAEAIHQRVTEVEKMVDTTLNVLDQKSVDILTLLDIITIKEVEIESMITKLETVILDKNEDIFVTDQESLFSLNYSNKSNWAISDSFWRYFSGNVIYLKDYLEKHIGLLIFQLILIIVLIVFFIRRSKLDIEGGKEEGAKYKKQLKAILSKPISAALILGLFASVLIFPYRPILFLDITRIIVLFPIVIVFVSITPRKYHAYIYIFGILALLHIAYLNLPATNIISRLILLFSSTVQVGALVHFLMQSQKNKGLKERPSKLITSICYFLIVIAITGFIGNLIGKVTLASNMVEVVLNIIFITILLSFSLLVFNGFTVLIIDSYHGDKLNIIKHNKTETKRKITRFFNAVAIIMLIYFIVGMFTVQSVVIDQVIAFFEKERSIGSFLFSWGDIFIFFFVIWLSIAISNFIRVLLQEDILNNLKLKKGLPYTIALMAKYTLVTLGIFLAVSAAGIPVTSLTVVLGAFGVGIGFGLQNIFNNLVSGLILLFERPIQIGDTIEFGTLMGVVRSIGIRSSNIRTFDGAEIIVPNGNLISNEVINWTLSDETRRIEVIVGVSYNSDPHKVKEVLMKILTDHEDVEDDPAPNVLFQNLGDSSLDFRMLFWTRNFGEWIRIRSEIIFEIFDELKAAGIEIPFPQHDLHLRSVDNSATIVIRNKTDERKPNTK
jgi:small-conductance mechanosensitive channel